MVFDISSLGALPYIVLLWTYMVYIPRLTSSYYLHRHYPLPPSRLRDPQTATLFQISGQRIRDPGLDPQHSVRQHGSDNHRRQCPLPNLPPQPARQRQRPRLRYLRNSIHLLQTSSNRGLRQPTSASPTRLLPKVHPHAAYVLLPAIGNLGSADCEPSGEFYQSGFCVVSVVSGCWVDGVVERVLEWGCVHGYRNEGKETEEEQGSNYLKHA
jgi:hypothetical protein